MFRQKISNVIEHLLDLQYMRRASSLPTQIHLSVTDRCFLPCLHCDIWKNDTKDLPTQAWLDTIDKLGKWCPNGGMNFVGGETLLRKDLEILIQRAVSYGFVVSFNTNGYLVTQERAQQLCDAGASIAYVSMDGIKKETVDHSRGREGSFEKAVQALSYFQEQNHIQPIVACILHAKNATEMIPLLKWCENRGYQLVIQPLYQNFGYVEYDPNWWRKSEFWPHTEKERQNLFSVIDELTDARRMERPLCNDVRQLQMMKFHFLYPVKDSGLSCRAGHSDLSFDPQGNVRLCYFLDPVGHMTEDIEKIWIRRTTLERRWQVSRCERHCNMLNCNFDT